MKAEKRVLITGSTDGIGLATSDGLASLGYKILMHGRTREKARMAAEKLKEKYPDRIIDFVWADLSNPYEIDDMCEMITREFSDLSILINNAGVFMNNFTRDARGYEMTFSVNHLSYFHITMRLLPLLLKNPVARVINVSSMAHGNTIHFDDLHFQKSFTGYEAYSQSKLANILFTYELDRKLKDKPVTVNCLHPGVINTKLLRAGWGGMGSSLEKGAATSIYLADFDEGEKNSGKYFVNKKPAPSSNESLNVETARRLWEISEEMTGVNFPF